MEISYSGIVDDMAELLFARRDNPETVLYLPQLIHRIQQFCIDYDTDSKPAVMADQVWRLFGSGDRRLGLWFIREENKVIGHLLAHPEPLDHEFGPWEYGLIRQAKVDKGKDVRDLTIKCMESVAEWGRLMKMPKLTMLTHRNESAMLRRFGWQPYKALMIMPL